MAACLGLSALAGAPLLASCTMADVAQPAPGRVSVLAGGRQLSMDARVGKPVRAHLAIANDGDQPVLLLGATPRLASDDLLTLVERVPGVALFDADAGEIAIARAGHPGPSVAVHYGLLFPGESIELYTTTCPVDDGWAGHDFRLDYLTAPWETLRQHLYLAGPQGPQGKRTFRRHAPDDDLASGPPADLAVPRLRRAILADGHDRLERGSVRFRVVLGPVEKAPLPLAEAVRVAGVEAGARLTYSDLLEAWAFERPGGVVAVRAEGSRRERFELAGVTVAALRALDRHVGAVPIVFADFESFELLRDLVVLPEDGPGDEAVVPRARLLDLLAWIDRQGLTLDTVVPAFTLAAKDPGASPLLARR